MTRLDRLAVAWLIVWGAAELATHPRKTLALTRGRGWYECGDPTHDGCHRDARGVWRYSVCGAEIR